MSDNDFIYHSILSHEVKVRLAGPMVHRVCQVYATRGVRWVELECDQHIKLEMPLTHYTTDEAVDCMACLAHEYTH